MDKDENLQKHTLNLFAGDYAKLQANYPDTGAGAIIRRIVRKFVERLEASDKPTDVDISINI